MATVRRNTPGPARPELDFMHRAIQSLKHALFNGTQITGAIGNGTTAGKLRTTASVNFKIGQFQYTKASTDDLWDLSALTDTTASQYRAYWLYLDASGTATLGAGANASTAALALAALPVVTATKSVIGVFVAGPSTDFNNAGGLAAQGTIYNGYPEGARLDVEGIDGGFMPVTPDTIINA